jgi:hypothetical protein
MSSDKQRIADCERRAVTLLDDLARTVNHGEAGRFLAAAVVKRLGPDAAREIFAAAIPRTRGRRKTAVARKDDELILALFDGGSARSTRALAQALYDFAGIGPNPLAIERRIRRLRDKRRKADT